MVCSPDIPDQLVDYLHLTPLEIQALQAQVTEQCKQVQPLVDRLEKSRRKVLEMKLNGKVDDREVQALAAEQSQIIKQLIVTNSQLETKLYKTLTSEQQLRVDGLLRHDSELWRNTTGSSIARAHTIQKLLSEAALLLKGSQPKAASITPPHPILLPPLFFASARSRDARSLRLITGVLSTACIRSGQTQCHWQK